MAALLLSVLVIAMAGQSSATWCVCKTGLSDAVLQKTLDYACGNGADCNPTHPKAPCFNPDNVRAHCNYAVNSFFQRKGQSPGTCDFGGTATPTNTDPSYAGCPFPASASAAAGGTTMTPGSTNPRGNTPATTTTIPGGGSGPYSATPSTGILGGNGTGTGINPDYSNDTGFGVRNAINNMLFCFLLSFISGLCSVLML
ncbi:PREDICTED: PLASMODESMATA CALLOSE-BINDING PROTEIN 1-like [Tarenaya hassleriana]|uniref:PLASMODESMATA CALLOSE-BINDING PROTEIN 1-like n=1 Tax=Tarenaya hassleriana TaxID=28532 RepID=UPI00053C33F5|nr:PREDICTED: PLASMODESMATA CALLOSE-BINDING PROTEIN 1-like [Tarenaya hassleriana]